MAYNRAEYERIDKMPLGELIHYLISHYENHHPDYADAKEIYMQSNEYFYACELLNQKGIPLGFPSRLEK